MVEGGYAERANLSSLGTTGGNPQVGRNTATHSSQDRPLFFAVMPSLSRHDSQATLAEHFFQTHETLDVRRVVRKHLGISFPRGPELLSKDFS